MLKAKLESKNSAGVPVPARGKVTITVDGPEKIEKVFILILSLLCLSLPLCCVRLSVCGGRVHPWQEVVQDPPGVYTLAFSLVKPGDYKLIVAYISFL